MYRVKSKHQNLFNFSKPLEMLIDLNDELIKLSHLIPWDEIEKEYIKLFPSKKGQLAVPSRLAFGALVIQQMNGYSDDETVKNIKQNPYYQYFCGFTEFQTEPPFNQCQMSRFRKRFSPELMNTINELIISRFTDKSSKGKLLVKDTGTNKNKKNKTDKSKNDSPNNGTLILDATCTPSNIEYPVDTDLLNEAREKLDLMIDTMQKPLKGIKPRPRTKRKSVKKLFHKFSKSKKHTISEIRKIKRIELESVRRNKQFVEKMLESGGQLPVRNLKELETIKTLYEQQKYMYDNRVNTVADRIVSIHQPWIRPIVRGKKGVPVEFGAKIDVSVSNGIVRLERTSFSAFNEGEDVIPAVERYFERTGFYPERVLLDQIYRNQTNIKYCSGKGIRLLGPPLGRRPKNYLPDKKQEYQDMCDRTAVERVFSLGKNKFGIELIYAKLPETALSVIGMSMILLNLKIIMGLGVSLFFFFVVLVFIALRNVKKGSNFDKFLLFE